MSSLTEPEVYKEGNREKEIRLSAFLFVTDCSPWALFNIFSLWKIVRVETVTRLHTEVVQ